MAASYSKMDRGDLAKKISDWELSGMLSRYRHLLLLYRISLQVTLQ